MKDRCNEQGFTHIVGLALLALVVGMIGFIGWRVYDLHSGKPIATTATKQDSGASTIPLVDKTSAGIIATAKKRLAAKYTLVAGNAATASPRFKVGAFYYDQDSSSPAWKPDGAPYFVYAPNGYGIGGSIYRKSGIQSAQAKADNAAVDATFKGVLSDAGLTIRPHITPDAAFGLDYAYYTNADIVCAILQSTSLACASLADYPTALATVKPFADLYLAQYPAANSDGTAAFGVPDVKDSKTVGYQLADVNIPDADAHYYSKNGVWHFWGMSQDELGCGQYNTQDLRLAYAGQPCRDDATQLESTVR